MPSEDHFQTSHFKRNVEMADAGLLLGADIIVSTLSTTERSSSQDRERLIALLTIAWRRPVTKLMLNHLDAASSFWRVDAKALANLRLVFADLPRLRDPSDAERLALASRLLDGGFSPRYLLTELDLDPSTLELAKYDPNQPRVPAGSGRASGQWTSGDPSLSFLPSFAATGRSFLGTTSPEIIASLTTFAARFATPVAVLGALFIPTPNSGGVTQGTLPEAPDIHFVKDGPAGLLRLTTTVASTAALVVAENQRGLYVDTATGRPIGRDLGGQLYLDLDAVNDAVQDTLPATERDDPRGRPAATDEGPKLCPTPTLDTPHGAKPTALDYEDDVHARVNPVAPIPRGFGVNLPDPSTGRLVFLDDCFRYSRDLVDGDMEAGDLVEAKGESYTRLLSAPFGERIMREMLDQAEIEKRVADARGVRLKWYFAERDAARRVRERFELEGMGGIVVAYMPSRRR